MVSEEDKWMSYEVSLYPNNSDGETERHMSSEILTLKFE